MSIFYTFSSGILSPIWMSEMKSTSTDYCLVTSNTCPRSSVTDCTHSMDISVECGKLRRSILVARVILSVSMI